MPRPLALRAPLAGLLTAVGVLASATEARAVIFTNPNPIVIPAVGTSGPASPYPATIVVSGATGPLTDLNVTISGFSHTFPDDVGALLVGPTGQTVVLFNGPNGGTDVVNLTWVFDDSAPTALPTGGTVLTSGTFRPSNEFPLDTFPGSGTSAPYGTTLAGFNGTNPNGTWSLYVFDFVGGDSGVISGGFSLDITAPFGGGGGVVPVPPAVVLAGLGFVGLVAGRRRFKLA